MCCLKSFQSLSDIYCSISLHVRPEVIFPDSSFYYERSHLHSLKAFCVSMLRLHSTSRVCCALLETDIDVVEELWLE